MKKIYTKLRLKLFLNKARDYFAAHWNLVARWNSGKHWQKMIGHYNIGYKAPEIGFSLGFKKFSFSISPWIYNFYLGWRDYPLYYIRDSKNDFGLAIYNNKQNLPVLYSKARKHTFDREKVYAALVKVSENATPKTPTTNKVKDIIIN